MGAYDTVADDPILVIGIGDSVLGLDRRSGERRWVAKDLGSGVTVEIQVDEARVFAVVGQELTLLDYQTGAVLGRVTLPTPAPYRPTMLSDRDHLYVACGGEVACVHIATGRVLWHDNLKGFGIRSVALGLPGRVRQSDETG
jgi:outer membrane protein assembly factor BamB